jgi:hypothetical protein
VPQAYLVLSIPLQRQEASEQTTRKTVLVETALPGPVKEAIDAFRIGANASFASRLRWLPVRCRRGRGRRVRVREKRQSLR